MEIFTEIKEIGRIFYNYIVNKGIEVKIAEEVKKAGGRVFYVGGYVRDTLLSIENKDVDIEVHGIEPEKLIEILGQFGTVLKYGDSFGVYSLSGTHMDIAMPRKEKVTGKGHRDFEIFIDPYIGVKEAARRRDFTINSLMMDVLTNEIVDSFRGQDDLKNRILRCVDPVSFIEDPLRVLRAAQFASRFGFEIEEKTLELCRSIDITSLSKERVFEEMGKALLKADKPSVFFESLRKMNQLSYWFKEVNDLIGIRQDPIHHPEGDVYIHTMEVLDRSVKYRNEVSDPLKFELLALCHDFGKTVTTTESEGRIHAYGHETEGLPIIRSFLHRLTNEKDILKYVLNMSELHMKPNALASQNSGVKASNSMFDKAIEKEDLIYFSIIDNGGLTNHRDYLEERLAHYNKVMAQPYVTGKDLLGCGIERNEHFSDYLAYAHKLRLSGVNKEAALKQTLAYIKEKE